MGMFWAMLPLVFGIRMVAFYGFGLYRGIWRYLDFDDAVPISVAVVLSTVVFAIDPLLCLFYCVGGRGGLRFIRETSAIERASAGETIGSELVRQVLRYEPRLVVAVDNCEPCLFTLLTELGEASELRTAAADIRFGDEIERLMTFHRIDVGYHAAAYKHVPLMENNVVAAFRTNVLGTLTVAESAIRCGLNGMVMISLDKAVRPTSMMGATNRLAEQILAHLPTEGPSFVSVRFGNVLGSSGARLGYGQDEGAHALLYDGFGGGRSRIAGWCARCRPRCDGPGNRPAGPDR
jgi:FlaA1/EpsC-like NDP-sugar epimerase